MVLKPKSSKIGQVLAEIDSNKQRFSQNPDFVARILATNGVYFNFRTDLRAHVVSPESADGSGPKNFENRTIFGRVRGE
jgi:hypothetical protein